MTFEKKNQVLSMVLVGRVKAFERHQLMFRVKLNFQEAGGYNLKKASPFEKGVNEVVG